MGDLLQVKELMEFESVCSYMFTCSFQSVTEKQTGPSYKYCVCTQEKEPLCRYVFVCVYVRKCLRVCERPSSSYDVLDVLGIQPIW